MTNANKIARRTLYVYSVLVMVSNRITYDYYSGVGYTEHFKKSVEVFSTTFI